MDAVSLGLEPCALWHYFLALSAIPRVSGREEAARAFAAEEGKARGCEVLPDLAGNLLLRQPASAGLEGGPPLALQAHLDMVGEAESGSSHDFTRDPIQVFREGDFLRARGTTLGADDGIGVAAALAVLSDPALRHGPLEVLLTVNEETGLKGARGLRPGWLLARRLINLDSQAEGVLTVGCAGALDTVATRKVSCGPLLPGTAALEIAVTGLRGGHSGIDIARGRGNAIRLLAQVLVALREDGPVDLVALRGGTRRNAIPREARAEVLVEAAREPALRQALSRLERRWASALGANEPAFALEVDRAALCPPLSPGDAEATLLFLLAAPHGVEEWSPTLPGLVQTSTNLARVETRAGAVEVSFLTRSALEAQKRALAARIAGACRLAGFAARDGEGYGGWPPEPESGLAKLVDGLHAELFGAPMVKAAVHAGLECGPIGEGHAGMEMISLGPSMWDCHTPRERLGIASSARFYRLLAAAVERVAASPGG